MKKWSPVKEILFSYLAISKILYWLNTATTFSQHDLGNVWEAVIERLLFQDFSIILGVVVFFALDKLIALKKTKNSKILEQVIYYVIGYVALVSVTFTYIQILSLFFTVTVYSWSEFIAYGTIAYLVVTVVLNVKHYFKEKLKPEYTPSLESADSKISMLKLLYDDGALTQEEYENSKGRLSVAPGRSK